MANDSVSADVTVCVCTFRRPAQLDGLLAALVSQSARPRMQDIVVVDNDPARSARDVLDAWSRNGDVSIRALACAEPNISRARNTAVAHASGAWLAFIDDDEIPAGDWLEQLLETAQSSAADAVFGPVLPVYGPDIPAWMIQGRFFERRRLPTGAEVTRRDVRSGNLLIRRALLQTVRGPFDPAFGRTGGEDTLLFTRLLQQPVRFIWCDEAVVREPVEPGRATLRWLLRRAYRGGQSYMLVAVKTARPGRRLSTMAYLLLRALLQLGLALPLALFHAPLSRARSVKWLRVACAQCGKMTGAMGFHHPEYRRSDREQGT